jgi:hypothetical protein
MTSLSKHTTDVLEFAAWEKVSEEGTRFFWKIVN